MTVSSDGARSTALRRLARIYSGGTPDRNKSSFWQNGTIPWLASGDVNQRRITKPRQFISEEGFRNSSAQWIPAGSVVMAIAGQGKTKGTVATLEYPSTCNQSLVAIIPDKRVVHYEYLAYSLESQYRDIRSLVGDGLRDGLNQDLVKALSIHVPLLDEQRAIARFLDRKSRRIARFIRARQRMIALLNEQKQAIIHQAVTRGLDPNVPLKPSGIDWLGDIPAHWRVLKASRVFGQIGSGTTPTSGDLRYYENGQIPWVITGDLNDGSLDHTNRHVTEEALSTFSALKIYPAGTLIVAMYGATIGKTGILVRPSTVNQACAALIPSKEIIGEYGLQLFLAGKKELINRAVGGGQPNISQDTVREFQLPVPPMEEQRSILLAVVSQNSSINSTISRFQREIELVREYRTRLIADVVTGKLDIRDHPDAAEVAPDDLDDTVDIDALLEPAPEGDADPDDLDAPE